MDRFDLEDALMAAWSTSDDIGLIAKMFLNRPEAMTEDELSNLLIGLNHQHNLRCQDMFNIFEELIQDGVIGARPETFPTGGMIDLSDEAVIDLSDEG